MQTDPNAVGSGEPDNDPWEEVADIRDQEEGGGVSPPPEVAPTNDSDDPWDNPPDDGGEAARGAGEGGGASEDPNGSEVYEFSTPAEPEQPQPVKVDTSKIDWRDVGIAMKEAQGNRAVAAAALGCDVATITARINDNQQLRALYRAEEKVEATLADAATRRDRDRPVAVQMTPEEQVEMINKQDREIQLKGLRGLGVGEKMISKLKSLDGMAKTSEKFLSVSVTTSYQMFAIQQIHLFEETEAIREMMKDPKLKASQRAIFQRLYLDFTREINRGHAQQFHAAAALVQMMAAARGRVDSGQANKRQKKVKPGFTDIAATPGE